MRRPLALLVLVTACGCGDPALGTPDAVVSAPVDGFPPPRTDIVGQVGTAGAVDIAAWNIENFPKDPGTPALMADLVASLGLDLIAVAEIESIDAWNELVARLPDHDGVLSSHTYGDGSYQKVGFLFRRDLMQLSSPALLFDRNGYEFPRPALRVRVTITAADPEIELIAIAVHLKAGLGFEDRARRRESIRLLEEYVRGLVDTEGAQVMLIGDFNEVVDTSEGMDVMGPWLDAPARYVVHTTPLAAAGDVSFLPAGVILDHIITTTSLDDELAGGATVIPRLDYELLSYEAKVSDHLPVVSAMPVLP